MVVFLRLSKVGMILLKSDNMNKTISFGVNRCSMCGEYASHFVPPSFREEGFFTCKKRITKADTKTNQAVKMDGLSCQLFEGKGCKYYNNWGRCYPDCLYYISTT